MSQTGPNVFIGIGDTDWWSTAHRHPDLAVDSRMLTAQRKYNVGAVFRSVCGNAVRAATTSAKLCAEFYMDSVFPFVGLVKSGSESTVLPTHPGAVAGSVGYYRGDNGVYLDGAGLGLLNLHPVAAGDCVSILYYRDASAVLKARWLVNGRYNILGRTEDFGHADWAKSSVTATGQKLTFTTSTGILQQNVTLCGGVGTQLTFSAIISAPTTQTIAVILTDQTDSSPSFFSTFVVGPAPTRCTVSGTLGAGYSGTLGLQIFGNGTVTPGTTLTVEQCSVNGGLVADPYQKRTDGPGGFMGHPLTLTEGDYRLATGIFHLDAATTLRVDRDDQQWLPSDCQPWGAAARVADAGGYSPAATKLETCGPQATIDVYGRTLSIGASGDNVGHCGGLTKSSSDSNFYYVEFLIEDATPALNSMFGFARRGSVNLGAYLGSDAHGWGIHPTGGILDVYHNAASSGSLGAAAAQAVGKRVGAMWQPSSGKLWALYDGAMYGGGDPQAGTGFVASNLTGDIVPAIAPRYECRIRVCTHAREQLDRPSYAKAWDGADLLPEQHYRGLLRGDVEIERRLNFRFPWGGSASQVTTVVDLMNLSGRYDSLAWADLRDQRLSIVRLLDSVPYNLARLRVDHVRTEGERSMRVVARDRSAHLDRRVDKPHLTIGRGHINPAVLDANGVYVHSHTAFSDISVYDRGSVVTTWKRYNDSVGGGFVRTVNPAGRHSVIAHKTFRKIAQVPVLNAGFTNWTGDNPDNFTVAENGTTALVTQVAGTCRLVRNAGAPSASILQGGLTTTTGTLTAVVFTVTAYVSGDLTVHVRNSGVLRSATAVRLNGTGRYAVVGGSALSWNEVMIEAADSSDVSIDNLEVWMVEETSTAAKFLTYLLSDLGGFAQSDLALPVTPLPTNTLGYYSNERPAVRQVLEAVLPPNLIAHCFDADERVLFVPLSAWITEAVVTTVEERDLFGDLHIEDDLAPALTDQHYEYENFNIHSQDEVDGSQPAQWRAELSNPGFPNKIDTTGAGPSDAGPLHAFYAHAINGPPLKRYNTELRTSSNVATGSYDVSLYWMHRCYRDRKRFVRFKYSLDRAIRAGLKLGRTFTLKHSRYGLSAGAKQLCHAEKIRAVAGTVELSGWG